jgi:hypothetical protein
MKKDLTPSDVVDFIEENGVPGAVGIIKCIYENAIDKENPWGSFPPAVASAAVHIARWNLGHDKFGKKNYPPKTVLDRRFNKIFWTYTHRQLDISDVVKSIAMVCIETFLSVKEGSPINYAPSKVDATSVNLDSQINSWLKS